MRKIFVFFFIISLLLTGGLLSCRKKTVKIVDCLNPGEVAAEFFDAYGKRDWKEMYRHIHPNMMKLIRNQALTQKQKKMSDEDLFALDFRINTVIYPGKAVKSCEIKFVPVSRKGDQIVWVDAMLNGKEKKVPLFLVDNAYKVDLTQMK